MLADLRYPIKKGIVMLSKSSITYLANGYGMWNCAQNEFPVYCKTNSIHVIYTGASASAWI